VKGKSEFAVLKFFSSRSEGLFSCTEMRGFERGDFE
jgi:hypothetical protein